ncbi:MAG: hypothetical protein AAGB26_10870 [Planctomycetota bacterium]
MYQANTTFNTNNCNAGTFILLLSLTLLIGCSESENDLPDSYIDTEIVDATEDQIEFPVVKWDLYHSKTSSFKIDSPFPPRILPRTDVTDGHQETLDWNSFNPSYTISLLVIEQEIYTPIEHAQKHILSKVIAAHTELTGSEPKPISWKTINGKLHGTVWTRNRDTGESYVLRACLAHKSLYCIVACDTDIQDSEEIIHRVVNSFIILDEAPASISAARQAELDYLFFGDMHDDPADASQLQLLFERMNDPNRGLNYQDGFTHPELSDEELNKLSKIQHALQVPYPEPWENWVHDLKIQRNPVDEVLAMWAVASITWERLGRSSLDEEQARMFIIICMHAQLEPNESIKSHPSIDLSQDLLDQIHKSIQGVTDDEINQWFNDNQPDL